MKHFFFHRWNVVALVLLVAVFSAGTFLIRHQMLLRADRVSHSLVHGSTKGYHKFLMRYFERFDLVMKQLDYSLNNHDYRLERARNDLNLLMKIDSAIVAVVVVNHDQIWSSIASYSSVAEQDLYELIKADQPNNAFTKVYLQRYLYMGGATADCAQCRYGILIDLHQMHRQFIAGDIYTSIYQVILNQHQQCIYHPDITFVGKDYPLPQNFYLNGRFNAKLLDSLHEAQSDYLQLPVFAEYSKLIIRGEEWLVLSMSPGFELKDLMADQQRVLMLLFFFFLIILIGILFFGLLRWKREFVLRAGYEKQTLHLQLKNEMQKSEMMSIKLELLRSGLNSHFMFNSLGTVKALLSRHDEKARDMLTDLSQLYRYQLKIEGEPMVSLAEELRFTQIYVDVINVRMSGAFVLEINNLDNYLECKVLPVSLQLLVENCIKHNIATDRNPLVISIRVIDNQIVVENQLRPKVTIVESSGKGLQNLTARYLILTNQTCTFRKENGRYIASIPIIK